MQTISHFGNKFKLAFCMQIFYLTILTLIQNVLTGESIIKIKIKNSYSYDIALLGHKLKKYI